ncbi:group 1 truncated hemoglobin [Nitrospira sp.]|nr:group 1 truncated hemoglobin [Nitrospira sp.]
MIIFNRVILGLLGLSLLAACAETRMSDRPSLYKRLVGKDAITGVVDRFVSNVAVDDHINSYFRSTDIPQLKRHLVDQVCEAAGGPCIYTGRSMKATHAGMGVTDADFNALVQDLIAALDFYKVGQVEQDELLSVLGDMQSDIVER